MATTPADQERSDAPDATTTGYWKLTNELMLKHNESAIFSRFSDLVIFDLLLRQAELCDIRKEFFGASKILDKQFSGPFSKAASWADLNPNGQPSPELDKWTNEIREKLQQYQDALNSATLLAARPVVEVRRLNHIQHLVTKKDVEFRGLDKEVYAFRPAVDVVALSAEVYRDPVSAYVARTILPGLSRVITWLSSANGGNKVRKLSGATIEMVVSVISTGSAAGYLIAVIASLYNTTSMETRLGMIAGFSLLHSLILCLFKTPGVESISAVSTFAAVEVIFISTNNSAASSSVAMPE